MSDIKDVMEARSNTDYALRLLEESAHATTDTRVLVNALVAVCYAIRELTVVVDYGKV